MQKVKVGRFDAFRFGRIEDPSKVRAVSGRYGSYIEIVEGDEVKVRVLAPIKYVREVMELIRSGSMKEEPSEIVVGPRGFEPRTSTS